MLAYRTETITRSPLLELRSFRLSARVEAWRNTVRAECRGSTLRHGSAPCRTIQPTRSPSATCPRHWRSNPRRRRCSTKPPCLGNKRRRRAAGHPTECRQNRRQAPPSVLTALYAGAARTIVEDLLRPDHSNDSRCERCRQIAPAEPNTVVSGPAGAVSAAARWEKSLLRADRSRPLSRSAQAGETCAMPERQSPASDGTIEAGERDYGNWRDASG